MDFRAVWEGALTFERFVAEAAEQHRGLWAGVHRIARIPEWAFGAVPAGTTLHLLVIAEDWCGDASNTTPVLAKWAAQVPGVALRLIRRDEHLDVMDRYRTNGARSIPIVVVLDGAFRELGHWGPRPAELQAWVLAHKATMPADERYKHVRTWYARDRGETTLREVLAVAGIAA